MPQWETKTDDYGRAYYANWETGEATYEMPAEMSYRPPLGRNELGEKVDPRLQALRRVRAIGFRPGTQARESSPCLHASRWLGDLPPGSREYGLSLSSHCYL